MRVNWSTDRNAPRARVINLETGAHLIYCAWADEEEGEVEQYVMRLGKDSPLSFSFTLGKDLRTAIRRRRVPIRIDFLGPDEEYFLPGLLMEIAFESTGADVVEVAQLP